MRKVPLKEGAHAEKKRAAARAWRLANPERYEENKRRYVRENTEHLKAYKAEWHREKQAAKRAAREAYEREHATEIETEKIRRREAKRIRTQERQKLWMKKNEPRLQAKRKAYYLATKEERAPKEAQRRAANAAQNVERTRLWREANPERYAALAHTRRVKAGPAIKAETSRRLLREKNCHYCKVGLSHEKEKQRGPRNQRKATIDHLLPVSRGGTNADENLVAACARCNFRKNAKTAEEYFALLARRRAV